MSSKPEYRYFGKNVKRMEAEEIVQGKTVYLDDIPFQDLLYVKTLRCPYASAKILRMDIEEALRVPGVASITYYGNLPEQCRSWGINAPAIVPVLHDYGCFAGDVVAVIAAETEQAGEDARDLIRVEYEVRKPVLTTEEAIAPGAPLVHPDTFPTGNIVYPVIPYVGEDMLMHLKRGDADKALEECDFVDESEAKYDSIGSPAPMEPPIVVWKYNPEHNDFHAWATTQTPHGYRLAAMIVMAGMKNDTTVVNVGGGFGNKAPMNSPTAFAGIAAVANPGRPCKYALTKTEQLIGFDERIGMYMKFKVGIKDGLVHAVKGECYLDCGAYNTCGQWQMGVGLGEAQIALGKCKNWDLDGKMVFTNHVQTGPVRGFGGQEIKCAMMPIVDRLVKKAGLDPVEFLANNFAATGDGWYWRNQVWYDCREQNYAPSIYETAEKFGWKEKWAGWDRPYKVENGRAYGVGVSVHGNADVGEDDCVAYVRLDPVQARVYVHQAAAEQGCGQRSNLRKPVAEILNMNIEDVIMVEENTEASGYGQGPAGSRGSITTMTAVTRGAEQVRNQLFEKAAEHWHVSPDEMVTENGMIWPKNRPEEKLPWVMAVPFAWQAHGVGHYYHDYSKSNFCVYFAEVSVDLQTGDARLEHVSVGSDVGQVIDPATLEMQFHGGFGAACADTGLMEENVIDRPTGHTMTGNLIDYKWRTFNDFPPIDVVIQESQPNISRWKAVGLGEISGSAGPSAIMMAISNAIGKDYCEYPATREGILRAMGRLKED